MITPHTAVNTRGAAVTAIFDALSEPVSRRVSAGMSRIAGALKSRTRAEVRPVGVTPSQAEALALLAREPSSLVRLARHLGVSSATASVAVRTLVDRGLVEKRPGTDRRSITVALTEDGARVAREVAERPPSLATAVATLPDAEQSALLVSVVKIVRELQVSGQVEPQRMCVTCRFFRPHAHPGSPEPHHCAFVDAPFADRHLRLDCPEQEDAAAEDQLVAWARFVGRGPSEVEVP
jgi:DNA-binding MarR family transcriptional regulator